MLRAPTEKYFFFFLNTLQISPGVGLSGNKLFQLLLSSKLWRFSFSNDFYQLQNLRWPVIFSQHIKDSISVEKPTVSLIFAPLLKQYIFFQLATFRVFSVLSFFYFTMMYFCAVLFMFILLGSYSFPNLWLDFFHQVRIFFVISSNTVFILLPFQFPSGTTNKLCQYNLLHVQNISSMLSSVFHGFSVKMFLKLTS